jgi:hypothetical protein
LLVSTDGDYEVALVQITNEVPSPLSNGQITLPAGPPIRLTLEGSGSTITGRIFANGVLEGTLSASDATYGSGVMGLMVLAGTGTSADATFDDFAAVEPSADSDADGLPDGAEVAQ